jgi:hypothetical protein
MPAIGKWLLVIALILSAHAALAAGAPDCSGIDPKASKALASFEIPAAPPG